MDEVLAGRPVIFFFRGGIFEAEPTPLVDGTSCDSGASQSIETDVMTSVTSLLNGGRSAAYQQRYEMHRISQQMNHPCFQVNHLDL